MNPAVVLTLVALAYVPSALAVSGKPYVQTISPTTGTNVGGTRISVTGTGFQDSNDLQCKFSRVDVDTEQVVEKITQGTYVSQTKMHCESPAWDEAPCPYCESDVDGTLCKPSCANSYPWLSRAAHANVQRDDGHLHYTATTNHHHTQGYGGAQGKFPCPSCSNEYDAQLNPTGQFPLGWKNTQDGNPTRPYNQQSSTKFYGHDGSKYLRTNNKQTPQEIGVGMIIKIQAQFFTVVEIESCTGVGCWCEGEWAESSLQTNATGTDIGTYPVGVDSSTLVNSAMYEYDIKPSYYDQYSPPQCGVDGAPTTLTEPDGTTAPNLNDGNWKDGTKIVLDSPLYKVSGTPNVKFVTNEVYVSSKKPAVGCSGKGCALTLTVTNDGRTYSGSGTNGKSWQGSTATFVARHVVPEVLQVRFPQLGGTPDSTRLMVPATGGTKIQVHGNNFQDSPLTMCYFNTPRISVPAHVKSDKLVECAVPPFVARRQDHSGVSLDPAVDNRCTDAQSGDRQFANDIYDETASSRLFDTECTNSMQNGAAKLVLKTPSDTESSYAFTNIQVTNNGKLQDLSVVTPKRSDGSAKYLEDEGSLSRSTCQQLPYPTLLNDAAVRPGHEQSAPCFGAHLANQAQGNDVEIKYMTCYDALTSSSHADQDYYGTEATGMDQTVNSTSSVGQVFKIAAAAAGPLMAVDVHLKKEKPSTTTLKCSDTDDCAEPARQSTTLEVCVSAGGFAGKGQVLACEWIKIQSIKAATEVYTVYFTKNPYLLGYYDPAATPGFTTGRVFSGEYYLTISYISGPETVSVAMSSQTATNGYYFDKTNNNTVPVATNYGYRTKFYTCDGCRWKYQSQQTALTTTYQVGKITGRQNRSETYLSTHPSVTCKSTLSQSFGRSYVNEAFSTAEGLPRVNTAEDPTGAIADECGTPTYREQMAQAFRPVEDVTVTKMRTKIATAFSDPATATHDDRTASGDFKSANGASVSVYVTEHGKLGEYVCQSFSGSTETSDQSWKNEYSGNGAVTNANSFGAVSTGSDVLQGCGENNKDCMHCDTNDDGDNKELCFIGAICNKSLAYTSLNGGCGTAGVCAMSQVVTNGHELRNAPDGTGPFTSPCGENIDCDHTQQTEVQHAVHLPQASSASQVQNTIWEFKHPIKLKKHTTYYVNMVVDESIKDSDSVYWYAGSTTTTPQLNQNGREVFFGSYTRSNVVVDGESKFVWVKNGNDKFDLELMRCVQSHASISSLSTSGEGTGTCAARSSPRGGIQGPVIHVKGENIIPSPNLHLMFLKPDGSPGPKVPCVATKYDYTEAECSGGPTFNPHEGEDCVVPGSCDGVNVVMSNDGVNYGAQYMTPKYHEPYDSCTTARSPSQGCDAVPLSFNGTHNAEDHFVQNVGVNLIKYCFNDIHVSTSGNDYSGDGTQSRPFQTIQRAINAANDHDSIVLKPGTYYGNGNTGLRHMGKKIEIYTDQTGTNNGVKTEIDCQHQATGVVINNNKDSSSPFAGFVDFTNVQTKNCESHSPF
jgi:hypothetical protein